MINYKKIIQTIIRTNSFQKVLVFFCFFLAGYFVLRIYIYAPSENTVTYSNNNFYVLGVNIPSTLDFCGEKIPSNNYEIKKNLEKEFFSNAYWKNNSAVLFAKAQKWFPYIEPILKKEGVPDDFKYVAVIESHLSNIVSPAGAAGFWQLVPASARNYNLEVNEYVDERYHVEKATHAACKLFKAAHSNFNNWTLSAAAYNLGIGGIQAALKKQNTTNYYDLLLNKETGSFVYRILAYKTLFSSPQHFGLKKKKWTYYTPIPYKVYKVDSAISNLSAFAKHVGCNKATIKFFNPWLLQDFLPNPTRKTYEIRVPKNLTADYSTYIRDLAGEDGGLSQDPEEAPVKTEVGVKDTLTTNAKMILHVVKENETIEELADFYEVKASQLRKWNNLKEKQEAVAGQTLSIYY
ncbi:MAG: transglycosylase SLT domain-containing protein [Bacteroidetes bacterium]|nr:transglycosylase SLT domain-containing protein [Bacteroidota bacterium]